MEEASSITKAIENAWNRAGQPQEFSVKILELPKTSFFGLKTAKSAKIAFFFNEVNGQTKRTSTTKTVRPLAPRPPAKPRTGEREDQRGQRNHADLNMPISTPEQHATIADRRINLSHSRTVHHQDNRPERPAPRATAA